MKIEETYPDPSGLLLSGWNHKRLFEITNALEPSTAFMVRVPSVAIHLRHAT
jgi:hypothetical protein